MAAVDYFLKVEGVEGESTDDKHKGEIELVSWSLGGDNATSFDSGGGGGVGKVKMAAFKFKKKTDKSSAKLLVACCTGEHIKTATLVCRKAGKEQEEFLTVILSPILVSHFDMGGTSTGDSLPVEEIYFTYGKIEVKYKEQKADGALGGEVIGGWDVTTNKKV